jgi:hypothetical protein
MTPKKKRKSAGSAPRIDQTAFRHTFLQILMPIGYMTEAEAKERFTEICGADDDADFFNFLSEMNKALEFAQFKVKTITNPADKTRYIGFVNSIADKESKRAGKYKNKEGKPDLGITAFFRCLLEHIATSDDNDDDDDNAGAGGFGRKNKTAEAASSVSSSPLGYISVRDAFRINIDNQPQPEESEKFKPAPIPHMGASARERALKQLVQDGWLAQTIEGGKVEGYCLGVRTLLELDQYLGALAMPTRRLVALTDMGIL